jgi:hypothetical protein
LFVLGVSTENSRRARAGLARMARKYTKCDEILVYSMRIFPNAAYFRRKITKVARLEKFSNQVVDFSK